MSPTLLTDILQSPGFWGFLGAMGYAANSFGVCYYAATRPPPDGNGRWGKCLFDGIIAVLIGTICAAAFTTMVAHVLGQKDIHAIAAMIGLLANPIRPMVEVVIRSRLETAVKAFFGIP
jgi:hypothetical protein